MIYPEYVEVDGVKYKINTDFRVAIKCDEIAKDNSIGDFEKFLGIICTLFGDNALNNPNHYDKLFELAIKYLTCGKGIDEKQKNKKADMDFVKDYGLIWASIMSDYNGLDIDKQEIHWWRFMDLINGLSNNELGNCCILNRVRNLRNYDTSKIEDIKEKSAIEEAKRSVALDTDEIQLSKEQEESMNKLNDIIFGKE